MSPAHDFLPWQVRCIFTPEGSHLRQILDSHHPAIDCVLVPTHHSFPYLTSRRQARLMVRELCTSGGSVGRIVNPTYRRAMALLGLDSPTQR
ncbi:hypothetical protein VTO42DRAFT_4527 [Malbranchea cinnamomea]